MNRFWIVLAVLISVNLTTPDLVKADGALKDVEISTGKNPKRRLNIPGTITRRYSWSFEIPGYANSDYTVLMAIDSEQHNIISNYNMENRHGWSNFRSIVQESTKALWRLIDEFRKVIPPRWSEERKVNFVLAFVQSLPYTEDVTTGYNEFYKYAIETLFDGGGDCEDTSILFASLLSGLDFEVALIIPPGHLAVGVKGDFRGAVVSYKNNNYYYCETTGTGWKLGQVPDDYKGEKVEIMPITPVRLPPKQVNPWSKPPIPPRPNSSPIRLSKGINQFETAVSYEKAIESFKYVLNQNGVSSKQRVLAHLYWGCSELGLTNRTEPNYNHYVRKAKEQFSEVFRHNPYQELPSRLYSKKKIRTLFEEVRKESIGELTVIALSETKIWIEGNGIKRKMLGTGTVRVKLFKGSYTVTGISKGDLIEQIVTIEPNRHKKYVLERFVVDKISPTIRLIKPDDGATFEIKQQITIRAEVTDDTFVKEVLVHFPSDSLELSKEGSSDIYTTNITVSEAGTLRYYLTATDGRNQGESEKRWLKITPTEEPDDEISPTIRLIKPDDGATFEIKQQITIRAEVTDDTSVKEVLVHFPSDSLELSKEGSSDIYTTNITVSEAGTLRYYLTATDGINQGESEKRRLKIIDDFDDRAPIINSVSSKKSEDNERITITAKVTDDVSVESVHLHYGFSRSSDSEPSRYYPLEPLKPIFKDTYEITIPIGSQTGYICYYVVATDGRNKTKRDPKWLEIKKSKPRPPGPDLPSKRQSFSKHREVWLSYALSSDIFKNVSSALDWDRGNVLGLAFLQEGKTYSTLGGQLNFSHPDRMNANAMVQWGPALGKSNIAFTVLGGIAKYEDFPARNTSARSTHTTPLLGAGLKFYLWDKIAIDGTSSFKIRSDYDTTDLYHYAVGIRFYICRAFNLRIGYGRWYLGNQDIATMQIGLGYTF